MDALTFLIASAHLKLRLEQLRRHPERWRTPVAIPNFSGLVTAMDLLEHELEEEAGKLHQDILSVKHRGLGAIEKGRDKVSAVRARVAQVETFVARLEGSNGAPPLSGSSTASDGSNAGSGTTTPAKELGSGEAVSPATPAPPMPSPLESETAPPAADPLPELTVNGVVTG